MTTYTQLVEQIVEHLEDQGARLGWGSLAVVVVEYLEGELTQRYLQHRYQVSAGHACYIFSMLKFEM